MSGVTTALLIWRGQKHVHLHIIFYLLIYLGIIYSYFLESKFHSTKYKKHNSRIHRQRPGFEKSGFTNWVQGQSINSPTNFKGIIHKLFTQLQTIWNNATNISPYDNQFLWIHQCNFWNKQQIVQIFYKSLTIRHAILWTCVRRGKPLYGDAILQRYYKSWKAWKFYF